MKKQNSSKAFFDAVFGGGKHKLDGIDQKEHWYVKLCKFSHKYFGKNAKKEIDPKYEVTLAFLDWNLTPQEFNSAPMFVMVIGFVLAFGWALLNYLLKYILSQPIIWSGTTLIGHPLSGMSMILYLVPFAVAFGLGYYIQIYPFKAAEKEKIKSLGYIPEIINYIVMAMKVSPNLERSIKFAADHGHGRVAKDFRKLRYDIHIGKYRTVEEALDYMAWKWGEYSEEFKHALMLIRSSVMEVDEGKRNELLDKAVTDALQGIKDKMDMYSRAMHQPSIYLYYLGVLLPLLLIIVIPVGSMMASESMGFLGSPVALILIYNIIIPLIALIMAKSILGKRPPARPIPKIPDNLPGLPKRGWFQIGKYQLPVIVVSLAIMAATIIAGYIFNPIVNPMPPAWQTEQVDAYMPLIEYMGWSLGIVFAICFYLWANNKDKRHAQLELVKMENDFQDTLYILASRLGEGKPMEEALKHTADFLPNSPVTKKIFIPTLQNITVMGMTLKMALFDKAYGSLRYVPSDFIRGTMQIVVESLTLGVQTAARSLVSLSFQLQDSQKVERSLKGMLEDITSMMSVMSTLIAPSVLGITVALQRVISNALGSVSGQMPASSGSIPGGVGGLAAPLTSVGSMFGGAEGGPVFDQNILFLVIVIYMVQIVTILMYFASQVTEGENDLAFKISISKALPIAMMIFFIVAFFSLKMVQA
ncbi:hypothetical protein K8R43_04035 [archaeon]|nr:hypothetical protein [archaeon]